MRVSDPVRSTTSLRLGISAQPLGRKESPSEQAHGHRQAVTRRCLGRRSTSRPARATAARPPSNKGTIVAGKVAVLCPKVQWRNGDPVVTFEKVFLSKLHKREVHAEQAQAELWARDAAEIVKDVESGAQSAEETAGMSYPAALGILTAYREAVRDMK